MPLMLADKKAIAVAVRKVAEKSVSVVAAENRGLTVSEMTTLRSEARKVGVHLQVVRNTLARRALEGTPFECMSEALVGPLCLAFSYEAPSAAARLLRDFSKDHSNLEVKALSIGHTLLGADRLEAIASLPTRDEAIAKLMYVMKAPVEKFVRTLNEPVGKFVRTLAAVRDAKQAA